MLVHDQGHRGRPPGRPQDPTCVSCNITLNQHERENQVRYSGRCGNCQHLYEEGSFCPVCDEVSIVVDEMGGIHKALMLLCSSGAWQRLTGMPLLILCTVISQAESMLWACVSCACLVSLREKKDQPSRPKECIGCCFRRLPTSSLLVTSIPSATYDVVLLCQCIVLLYIASHWLQPHQDC